MVLQKRPRGIPRCLIYSKCRIDWPAKHTMIHDWGLMMRMMSRFYIWPNLFTLASKSKNLSLNSYLTLEDGREWIRDSRMSSKRGHQTVVSLFGKIQSIKAFLSYRSNHEMKHVSSVHCTLSFPLPFLGPRNECMLRCSLCSMLDRPRT